MSAKKSRLPVEGFRHLGVVEHFFFALHQILGTVHLVGMYKLSSPISLRQLRQCAEKLRSRYQILQVTVQYSWNKCTAKYAQGDNLKLNVRQEDHPTDPIELMHTLLTQEEEAKKKIVRDGQSLMEHASTSSEFLPWSLHLSHAGDYVIISSPHHIIDGVSLEILGAEIVRILNGKEMIAESFSEIPKLPVEQEVVKFTWSNHIKSYFELAKEVFCKMDMLGIQTKRIPRDWTQYKSIVKSGKVDMSEIANFYKRCKDNKVTLNSGMVSAFYEAVARTPPFNIARKSTPVVVAFDSRRRVKEGSELQRHSVGMYSSPGTYLETGDCEKWEERAKSIQGKVHSDHALHGFAEICLNLKFFSRFAPRILPTVGNDKNRGRHGALGFSNLGRTKFINDANDICSENGVQIESMFFDDSGSACGCVLSVHAATVGDILCWCISAHEPFVSQPELNAVNHEFYKLLTN